MEREKAIRKSLNGGKKRRGKRKITKENGSSCEHHVKEEIEKRRVRGIQRDLPTKRRKAANVNREKR